MGRSMPSCMPFNPSWAGPPAEDFRLLHYSEHSLGSSAKAVAVAYIEIETSADQRFFGVGQDTNIGVASIRSLVSAVNRSLAKA
jgi:2-isopropylmalate synthase